MATPAVIIVPAVTRHTSTVIIAHGLGDSGAGWSFLSDMWRRQNKFPETKFLFPSAPQLRVTANMGMMMPGWYDIKGFDAISREEDESGIIKSQAYFHSLISAEIADGIPSERIVLGGFSQGGAISLLSGVTSPTRLGGVFGLSCYLLLRGKLREMVPSDSPNKDTPIFMGHGDRDPVVKHEYGKATAEQLREWGWNVDFKTYRGLEHSADPQELADLENYIKARIPDQGGPAGSL